MTHIAPGNLMIDISDHFANFIILLSDIRFKETDRPMVRMYKNTSQKLFGDVNKKNVNDAVVTFSQKITVAYDKFFH